MAFKASKGKSGLFDIHGLEAFIEKKISEVLNALGMGHKAPAKPAPVAKPAAPAPVAKAAPVKKAAAPKKAKATKAAASAEGEPLDALLKALESHPKKAALIKGGKQKDQLLRALIPLYVGSKAGLDVSSGTTSKFWQKHGVKFAAPNAAKALREHAGFSKRTAKGVQISPTGVKYVETALNS